MVKGVVNILCQNCFVCVQVKVCFVTRMQLYKNNFTLRGLYLITILLFVKSILYVKLGSNCLCPPSSVGALDF